MLYKTRGIALQTIKFSETSIIAKIYTELFGLQSYLIKGIRKQHSAIKPGLFQPLTLLDLTVYRKERGNLQSLKEASNHHPYQDLPFNIIKSSVALFIDELLCKSIKEEEPNQALFDFLINTCMELDSVRSGVRFFPLIFAVDLTRYLGFYPQADISSAKQIFNLREGVFQENIPDHKYFIKPPLSKFLKEIIISRQDLSGYILSDTDKYNDGLKVRNELLDTVLIYYQLHLPDFREMKSHKVLHSLLA